MAVTMEEILAEASAAGASDVHIIPGIPPRMRVGGVLSALPFPRLLPEDTLTLLVSVLSQSQREYFEKKGACDAAFTIRDLGRFRVSAYRQQGSVAMALRLLGTGIPSPEKLGIPEQIMELYQKKQGLVLVTGASGSGRTTTLAALLDRINSMRAVHIVTLEDPVEFLHPHRLSLVSQREIGLDCATYAAGLHDALREDAEVIMAGNLQDYEAFAAALTAVEAGHLVLAALQIPGADAAVNYLLALCPGEEREHMRLRLSQVFTAVIFQKLVPDKEMEKRRAVFELVQI